MKKDKFNHIVLILNGELYAADHSYENIEWLTTQCSVVSPVKANSCLSTCSSISLQACAFHYWVCNMAAIKNTPLVEIVGRHKGMAGFKETVEARHTQNQQINCGVWVEGINVSNHGLDFPYLPLMRSQMESGLHGTMVEGGSGKPVGNTDGILQLG